MRRWRLGVETAVARSLGGIEDRRLTLESENAPVHQRLAQPDTDVVDEIAGRKVVAPVYYDVEARENLARVRGGKTLVDGHDANVGVEVGQPFRAGLNLGSSDGRGAMEDLPLEIADVHPVEIDQAQGADTRGRQVKGSRRPQSSGAHDQNAGCFEPRLTLGADARQGEVAGVAEELSPGKGDGGHQLK